MKIGRNLPKVLFKILVEAAILLHFLQAISDPLSQAWRRFRNECIHAKGLVNKQTLLDYEVRVLVLVSVVLGKDARCRAREQVKAFTLQHA